jgi:5-methylcytosine-specific restriction endonuclease McrA
VQFTASAELKGKLARAADLMRHTNPSGDLSVVVERALDLLIAKLERQRLGRATRPRRAATQATQPGTQQVTGQAHRKARRGALPRAVRREVFERNGEQCTFVDDEGRRCEARTLLELDHVVPRAAGGADSADNLRGRCRHHNMLSAERDFGREVIERVRRNHPRQRGYEGGYERGCTNGGEGQPCEHEPTARRALCGMGFKDAEARRAIETVSRQRTDGPAPPIETLLCEALRVLA